MNEEAIDYGKSRQYADSSGTRPSMPAFHASFIGRDEPLALLKGGLDGAARGKGAFFFVRGPAGIGKTRLTWELRDYARSRGFTDLAADCAVDSMKIPYQPFSEIMDQYIKEFLTYNEIERAPIRDELLSRFNKKSQILMEMNPRMRIVFGREFSMDRMEPEHESRRFVAYAADFFLHLSMLEKTILLVFDNMQWMDRGSVEIMNGILKSIGTHPVMIVGVIRTGEPEAEPVFVQAFPASTPQVKIDLEALSGRDVDSLLAALLPGMTGGTGALSDYLKAKCGGNPFFIIEMLKRLVEDGLLVREGNAWTIHEESLRGREMGASIVDVLLGRLSLMNPEEMEILQRAAVVGPRFDRGILSKIAARRGHPPQELIGPSLQKAAAMQLLEPDGANAYRFAHDKIKETLLASLDARNKRELHRLVGLAMEGASEGGAERIFSLADHFMEAEDFPKAVEYALRAGLEAKRIYANEDAIHYLSFAHSRMDERDERRFGVLETLGDLNCLAGRRQTAIEAFTLLSMRARGARGRSRILYKLGQAHYRLEDDEQCIRYIREALGLMGQRFPRNALSKALGVSVSLASFALNPMKAILMARERPRNAARMKAEGILSAFIPLVEIFFRHDILALAWISVRGLNISLHRLGRSPELAFFLSLASGFFLITGRYGWSSRLQDESLRMLRDDEAPAVAQATLRYLAALKEWTGAYQTSLEFLDRSMRISEAIGDRQALLGLYMRYRNVYHLLGDYAKAKEYNEAYYRIGKEQDDAQVIGDVLYYRSLMDFETGEWRGMERHLEEARNVTNRYRPLMADFSIALMRGGFLLSRGDTEEAVLCLEEAKRIFALRRFSPIYTGYVMIWLSDAYLERYAALDRADPRRNALLVKMKRHDIMTFERLRPLPAFMADAFLARAKLLDAEGKLPGAERNFRRSIEEAEGLGRKHCLARASLEFGRFLDKNGRKGEAEGALARAYRLFREMGTGDSSAPVPALGMDRWRAPAAARTASDGKDLRFMARLAQLSGRAEWEAAMEELAEMIGERARAEFVCVIGVDPATEELKILGSAGLDSPAALKDALSLPAVYTAIARRETYMSGDSACVPVLVRGAIRGACYLGNPRSGAPVAADLDPAASLAAHACQVWENLSLDPGRAIGIDPDSFNALCDEAELTKRERELLLLVVKGRSNKEICVRRSISISTLRTHLNHVYLKVGTSDRERLIARFSSKLGFD